MNQKVMFLGMGGTIAGRADSANDNVGYRAGAVPLAEVLSTAPGLIESLGGRGLLAEQLAQLDSKDMDMAAWALLATRISDCLADARIDAVVITHGTDTIEETAYFLSRVLSAEQLARKPVVMTCAMRPASALFADGPGNLLDAATVACSSGARGVMVACAGTVHSARYVQKVHTYRLDPFESVDAAPVGVVEEGRVRLVGGWDIAGASPPPAPFHATRWGEAAPRVEIVLSHAGATGHLVQALLAPDSSTLPLQGLVVAGTGNGTIHRTLEEALEQAKAQGVSVVRVSRCAHGQVVQPRQSEVTGLRAMAMPALKARIELMLELHRR